MSRWDDVDLPILTAVRDLHHADDYYWAPDHKQVAAAAGLDEQRVARALGDLADGRYVNGELRRSGEGEYYMQSVSPTERTFRLLRDWPADNAYRAMLDVIDKRLTDTTDDAERTRLERLRDSFGDLSKTVGTSLLTAFLRSQLGL